MRAPPSLAAATSSSDEDQVAFRDGIRYVARLTATDLRRSPGESFAGVRRRLSGDGRFRRDRSGSGAIAGAARRQAIDPARPACAAGTRGMGRSRSAEPRGCAHQCGPGARSLGASVRRPLSTSVTPGSCPGGSRPTAASSGRRFAASSTPPVSRSIQLLSDHRDGDLEAIWRGR
jgi:hypothetical protein